jgi:nucleoid-associated protein YgaU
MFGPPLDIERAFGHGVHVGARTRVRARRVSALLVGGALLAGVSGQVANAIGVRSGGNDGRAPRAYVVRPGDTLWSIAGRLQPDEDPRIVVDRIAAANALDPAALVPGQELVVPAG